MRAFSALITHLTLPTSTRLDFPIGVPHSRKSPAVRGTVRCQRPPCQLSNRLFPIANPSTVGRVLYTSHVPFDISFSPRPKQNICCSGMSALAQKGSRKTPSCKHHGIELFPRQWTHLDLLPKANAGQGTDPHSERDVMTKTLYGRLGKPGWHLGICLVTWYGEVGIMSTLRIPRSHGSREIVTNNVFSHCYSLAD